MKLKTPSQNSILRLVEVNASRIRAFFRREPLNAPLLLEDQLPLERLNREIKDIDKSLSVLDYFAFLRALYLEKIDGPTRRYIIQARAEIPELRLGKDILQKFRRLAEREGHRWDDLKFHLKYRIHTFEMLGEILGPEAAEGAEAVKDRYLLSVLPLNILLPQETKTKFIPPADYFALHLTGTPDPYGIWMKGSLVLDREGKYVKKDGYLASRKFKDVILVNITETCAHGCAGCYKSPLTREKEGEVAEQFKLRTEEDRVLRQTRGVVEWLNRHPEVGAVVRSGGEPLTYPNRTFKEILEEYKWAEHLKVLRICTGVIFMGTPWRIDDELIGLLKEFSRETGKRVAFNAHISNHQQITPEALVAVKKIKEAGFDILLQMPIQAGVNFFAKGPDDEDGIKKTIEFFVKASSMANAAGLQNYKWIVDMQPRTQERVVPIELLAEIINRAFETHEYSDMTRPNFVELLCRQGNVYLNKQLIDGATAKMVDREMGTVAYFISPNGKDVVLHRERLIPGVNDGEMRKPAPGYEELLARAMETYRGYLRPIEKAMKEVAEDEGLNPVIREMHFKKLQAEFLAAHDKHFPPIVEVGVD